MEQTTNTNPNKIKVIICPDGVSAKTLNPLGASPRKTVPATALKAIIKNPYAKRAATRAKRKSIYNWQKAEDERKVYKIKWPKFVDSHIGRIDFKELIGLGNIAPGTEHWAILVNETTCKIL